MEDQKEKKRPHFWHHHHHGPKFHHFKRGPLKCKNCGEEIQFKWERPKEGEPRKRPEPPKCQKCGTVWERPKPKCPFCQAELPKPDFKKFHKPPEPEPKPEKKEESSSSSSSSEDDNSDFEEEDPKPEKPKLEKPKLEKPNLEKPNLEKPKFEKPKCPNCQKELPFFFGIHGHRHGFMRRFRKHGHRKCPEKKEG